MVRQLANPIGHIPGKVMISTYVIDKLPISDKTTMAHLTTISPHTYILVVTIKLMELSGVSKTRSFLYYRPCQAPGEKKGFISNTRRAIHRASSRFVSLPPLL